MRMNAALQAYWITHPLQIQNAGWQHSVHAGGVCSVSSVEQMICLCWHRSKWVLQKVPSIKNKQRPSLHEFWSNNSHSHLQSSRTFSEKRQRSFSAGGSWICVSSMNATNAQNYESGFKFSLCMYKYIARLLPRWFETLWGRGHKLVERKWTMCLHEPRAPLCSS